MGAIQAIDMHTHVFNQRYFPLEGIFNYRLHKIPKPIRTVIARGLKTYLNAITRDGSAAGEPHRKLRRTLVDPIEATSAAIADMAMAAPPELRFDPDVRAAILASTTTHPEAVLLDAAPAVLNAEDAAPAEFATLLSNLRLIDVTHFMDTVAAYIRWAYFLTNSEETIVKTLTDSYPEVDIFVHHMMDLEHYYKPGDCYYDFVREQIPRMRKLVEQSEGRLMTFVAWSPRRENDVDLIEHTVTNGGAAGVKIYPPSGYKPADPKNEPLWVLAEKLPRLPLFAHCMLGGFEAAKGYDKYGDPKGWIPVLEAHPKLNLCLGHAGGEEGWFATTEKAWGKSYTKTVVELCGRYESVYCESGFLPQILDPKKRKRFVDRLAICFRDYPRFADRFMYGTDWHMIERIEHHRDYFEAFQDVFVQLNLPAERFFYANAAEFLNLGGFLERHAGSTGFNVDAVRPHLEGVQAKAARMR